MRLLNKLGRSFMLKRIAPSVFVEDGQAVYVEKAYPWEPVAFPVRIRNMSPVRVTVRGVQYLILKEGRPIQCVIWMRGWHYASNGLQVSMPDYVSATRESGAVLRYNRLLVSPAADLPLGVEGFVTFDSAYGEFEQSFLIRPLPL